jgi:hypothetical protein
MCHSFMFLFGCWKKKKKKESAIKLDEGVKCVEWINIDFVLLIVDE